jgi:predicted nuclease with RNAse H fold
VKRACDTGNGAQAPLKHQFQTLFNMTLLGNGFLARLQQSGLFDVVPFQSRGRAEVIEVYPGHMMRALDVPEYKRAPRRAIDAALRFLRRSGIAIELDRAIRRTCETYDSARSSVHDFDAADALVAASVAILYREGRAREAVPAGAARQLEGAIWSI